MDKNDIDGKIEDIGVILYELGFEAELIEIDETLQEIYNKLDVIEKNCKDVFDFAYKKSDEEHPELEE